MTRSQKFFSALGRFIKDFFTKNILLKIVVLLFSVLLWGFVIAEENPEYTKRIYGVKVDFRGEETLLDNGWMIVSRSATDVDLDIKCAIGKHSSLDASRVKCYVDLSTINLPSSTDEDTKVVTLDVEASLDSGFGVIEDTVEPIQVEIARLATRQDLTVKIVTEGEEPEGIKIYLPKEETISLSAQKSKIDRIASCRVTIDLGSFQYRDSDVIRNTYDVQFFDQAGEVLTDIVNSDGETVKADVDIEIKVYKDVPIVPNFVMTQSFESYCNFEYRLGEQSVRLFAEKRDTLDAIESIKTELIGVKMLNDETNRNLSLIFPEGTSLENGSTTKYVPMYLHVTEIEADPVEFTIPIRYSQTKTNIFRSGKEPDTVTFRVTGTVRAMEVFNTGWLSASVNVDSFNNGSYSVPIVWAFAGNLSSYRVELLDNEDGSVKDGRVQVDLMSAGQYSPPEPTKPSTGGGT